VEALVFKSGISQVTWRSISGGSEISFSALSEFDWNKMFGFQQIESPTHQFSFLLLVQGASLEQEEQFRSRVALFQSALVNDPKVRGRGFELMLPKVGGREGRAEALQFMNATHRFIRSNRQRIELTVEARERSMRQEWERKIADRGKRKLPMRVRFRRVLSDEKGR
jgi:hypothetical protein